MSRPLCLLFVFTLTSLLVAPGCDEDVNALDDVVATPEVAATAPTSSAATQEYTGDAPAASRSPATPSAIAREAAHRAEAPAAQPPGNAVRMRRLSVQDPGINNIEAVSFLVPQDWHVEGGIQWFPDFSVLAMLLMKITDPESGAQIQFLPIQNFEHLYNPIYPIAQWTNNHGNIILEPMDDPARMVETFYFKETLPHLAGATLVDREDLPKVAALQQHAYGEQSSALAQRLRYEFTHDGQPWQEDVFMTVVYTKTQLGVLWSVVTAYSFRAPAGVLDEKKPLLHTIVNSARLSQDWHAGYMHVRHLFHKRIMDNIRSVGEISRMIAKNSDEIRQMYADSYKERQATEDRLARETSETIRDVETYHNPYEDRPVELPSGYKDVWVNPQGEYLLSDNVLHDPNIGSTVEWQKLNAVE